LKASKKKTLQTERTSALRFGRGYFHTLFELRNGMARKSAYTIRRAGSGNSLNSAAGAVESTCLLQNGLPPSRRLGPPARMHPAERQCDSSPRTGGGRRAAWLARGIGLAVFLPCAVVLAMAVWLHPDYRGYDTHTQLDLPACSFVQRTGMPCPTCGMTTAFACMARGRVLAALRAQSFGAVLFLAAAGAAALGAVQAVSGRPWPRRFRPRSWWLWLAVGGIIAGWAIKMAAGLMSGELPVH